MPAADMQNYEKNVLFPHFHFFCFLGSTLPFTTTKRRSNSSFCAPPSVVRPQIISRLAAYRLLQHLHKAPRNLIVRQCCRLTRDKAVGTCVISPFRPAHLYIEHRIVHLFHYSLTACEHWRERMVEERHPQMNVFPFRRLVTDISEDVAYVLPAIGDEIAQDVFLRHRNGILLMTAYAPEELVKGCALQRMVYQPHAAVGRQVYSHAAQPLPVAVMAENNLPRPAPRQSTS